jgi:hypothetical protein
MGEFEQQSASEPVEAAAQMSFADGSDPAQESAAVEATAAEDTGASVAEETAAEASPAEEPAAETPADEELEAGEPAEPVAAVEEATPAEGGDELEAALAAVDEQIGVESAPEAAAPEAATPEPAPVGEMEPEAQLQRKYGVPWWPFFAYLVMWIALVGIGVWQLYQLPAQQVAYETQVYMLYVLAGLVMALAGLLLIIAVWLGTWLSHRRHRVGLLSSALFKGALITAIGVAIWWGSLVVVDYLRLGRTF